jgi:hypothetical protein
MRLSALRAVLVLGAFAGWALPACDDGAKAAIDAGVDGGVDDAGSTDDELPAAGEDLDERTTKELSSSYPLPQQFYDALDTMGIDPAELTYPDASSTFSNTPTRLHWTDTVRHDAQTGPTFGHMAAEDVKAALAADPPETLLRELLVAEYVYNDRDAFTISRYDEKIAVDDPAKPLLAALRAYYEHAPVPGSPWSPSASWEELEPELDAQLSSWPLDVQDALALAIEGLTRAAELRNAAVFDGGYAVEDWELLHQYFLINKTTYVHYFGTDAYPYFDFELMNRAGQLAARSLESLRVALAASPLAVGRAFEMDGPYGRIAVSLEDAVNEWCGDGGDVFLLVDGGGDDTYLDFVATNTSLYNPVSVLLDLAGDDTYTMSTDWSVASGAIPDDDPMQGAGILGVAILDDAAGDDLYHAANDAQGCGVFGVGALIDHGGNDRYEGYIGSQGHAQFGYGLLADLGDGTDSYETLQESQGYGGPRGIGWLVDDGGNDTYLAIQDPLIYDWAGEGSNWSGSQGFGFGVRDGYFTEGAPIFSGGLGGLFDLAGDDDYQCAVMCMGFGYAFGAGIFYDGSGNDDHLITHKYAIGGATHWAIGIYFDEGGEDTYRNNDDDECIGIGYDGSVAFHIDRGAEKDTYTLDNFGEYAIGVSRIPATGVLINEGGDDEYHVPGDGLRAIGRARLEPGNRDGYYATVINLGMFLDLGGASDVYDIARDDVGNGLEWIQTDGDDPTEWNPQFDFGYGLDEN